MLSCVSLWQPYASLAILGHKGVETRPFPAPASLIGQRLGIASTKQLKPVQFTAFGDPKFQQHYQSSGLGVLEELPLGVLLGTAIVESCVLMTEELIAAQTEQELAYGWWTPGRFAWFLCQPEVWETPVPVRGMQGLWNWAGERPPQDKDRARQEGPTEGRCHLPFA